MKEKKSPKPLPTDDIQRYNAVLIEEMRSQFKAVGENVVALRNKVDEESEKSEKRFEALSNSLLSFRYETKERFTKIEGRIAKLEESNLRIEARIAKLEESNNRIESDVRLIKNDLKGKVSFEEFKVLENRLAIVEKRLAAVAS